jgi:hypothetical protein
MVFGPVLESFRLPLTVPWALHDSGENGAWVGSWRGCLVSVSSSVLFSSVPCIFLVMRWLILKKVPGVTTLWCQPFLEAKPS